DPTNDPHTDYTTNYLVVPYAIYFGPSPTPTPTPAPIPTPGANTRSNDPKSGGDQCPTATPPPMARYSVHSTQVSLNIEDRPVRYTPPYGPWVDFTVTYNQSETQQPA